MRSGVLMMLVLSASVVAQTDLEKAKRKRLKDGAADFWIYDDVDKGYARAKKTNKPLLVSFRCVP